MKNLMEENKKSKKRKVLENMVIVGLVAGFIGVVANSIYFFNRIKGCEKIIKNVRPIFDRYNYRIDIPLEELDFAEKVALTPSKEIDPQEPYEDAFLIDYDGDGIKDLIYNPKGVPNFSLKYCKIKYGKGDETFGISKRIEGEGAFKTIVKKSFFNSYVVIKEVLLLLFMLPQNQSRVIATKTHRNY